MGKVEQKSKILNMMLLSCQKPCFIFSKMIYSENAFYVTITSRTKRLSPDRDFCMSYTAKPETDNVGNLFLVKTVYVVLHIGNF